MTSGMAVMTIALTVAGIVQIYLERMLGLPFAEAQSYLGIYYDARFFGGALMIAGIALFLADVLALRSAREPVHEQAGSQGILGREAGFSPPSTG
jgi:nitric oxide reductase subunit B